MRDSLHSYFRSHLPPPACDRWAPTDLPVAALEATKLLVGDPADLSLSSRCLVESCGILSRLCHAAPRSPLFHTSTFLLEWFAPLARPSTAQDSPEGRERVLDSLRLRSACACETPDFDQLSPLAQREAAFELAQELPCFDRDLTSLYLSAGATSAIMPQEYELHVAHSLLRLSPAPPSLSHFLANTLPKWREQGLLHVLALAAVNMPSPELDWRIDDADYQASLRDLLRALPLARSYDAAADCLSAFISRQTQFIMHQGEAAAQMAATLDRLAVLMRVKSNADAAADHSLDASLETFVRVDPAEPLADAVPRLWAAIKPSLELALPPSLLIPPPAAGVVW